MPAPTLGASDRQYDTPLSVGCSQRPTAARHPPNNRERKEFRHFTADKSTRNIQANSPGKTHPVSRIHLHSSSSRRLRWLRRLRWPGRFHRFVRPIHPFHPLCGFDSWIRRSRCTRSRISSKLRPRFCSFKWVIPQTSPNPFPKNQCTSPVDYTRLAGAFRLGVFGLQRSQTQMGGYLRRMKGKLGKAEGTTAAAHKLARIVHGTIKSQKSSDKKEPFKLTPQERGPPPQSPRKTSSRPRLHPSARRVTIQVSREAKRPTKAKAPIPMARTISTRLKAR